MAFANYNFGLVGFNQKTAKSFENLGMNVACHIYANDKKKKKQTSARSKDMNFQSWKSYNFADEYTNDTPINMLASAKDKYMDEFIRCTDRWTWSSELVHNWNDYDHLFNIACNHAFSWLKEHKINCLVYSNVPHQGIAIAQYAIARELGIKILIFNQTLFAGKTWLVDDWKDLGYFNSSASGKGFPISILPPTEPPFYMQSVSSISKRNIKNKLQRLRAQLIITFGLTGHSFEKRKSSFNRNVKRWQNALEQKRYLRQAKECFSDTPTKEKYVYFPLHLQPEMTTDVLGSAYADQMYALEALRQIVPLEIPIYVKENPKQTGILRSEVFFKRLKRLKKIQNIKLISHHVSSFELIQNSTAVSTITGTAGWEALRMQKPVIVFGSIFWNQLPGAFHVSKKPSWREIEGFKYNIEKLQKSVDKISKFAHDGVVDIAYSQLIENFDEQQNDEQLATAIADHLQS